MSDPSCVRGAPGRAPSETRGRSTSFPGGCACPNLPHPSHTRNPIRGGCSSTTTSAFRSPAESDRSCRAGLSDGPEARHGRTRSGSQASGSSPSTTTSSRSGRCRRDAPCDKRFFTRPGRTTRSHRKAGGHSAEPDPLHRSITPDSRGGVWGGFALTYFQGAPRPLTPGRGHPAPAPQAPAQARVRARHITIPRRTPVQPVRDAVERTPIAGPRARGENHACSGFAA